jgi:hypothetical protein
MREIQSLFHLNLNQEGQRISSKALEIRPFGNKMMRVVITRREFTIGMRRNSSEGTDTST